MLNKFIDIVGWVTGEASTSAAIPPPSLPSTASCPGRPFIVVPNLHASIKRLSDALASEFGCTSFAIYKVDQAKGVLWPTPVSSGDHSRLRPVDLMSHHNLRHAINDRACIIYNSAVLIEEFPALVSAFVPLVENDCTEQVMVMFDLRNAFDSSYEQELRLRKVMNDVFVRTMSPIPDHSCSASVTESVL